MSNPEVNDEELEALMAELEAQSAELVSKEKAKDASPIPAAPVEVPATCDITEDDVAELAELDAVADAEQHKAQGHYQSQAPAATEPEAATFPQEQYQTLTLANPEPAPVPELEVKNSPAKKTSGVNGLSFHVDVDEFRRDTSVKETNLDQCMIEQSGLRAYYGAMAAQGEAQASRNKAKFEVVEATLYDHHRKELAATGEKVTEKMVENAVKLDPRWLRAKNLVIEAETIAAINKGLVESLRDRKDMLVQLGADRREEHKGALRVMDEKLEREDLRRRADAAYPGRAA